MEGICKLEDRRGLEWIIFNNNFNQELTPEILEFLSKHKRVQFGKRFNQSIDNLPNSITHIKFVWDSSFNHPLDNLPISLKSLVFNGWSKFNYPLDNLPDFLEHLETGSRFNHLIDNLPRSLITIKFGTCFNQSVNNIPRTVKNIFIEQRSRFSLLCKETFLSNSGDENICDSLEKNNWIENDNFFQ